MKISDCIYVKRGEFKNRFFLYCVYESYNQEYYEKYNIKSYETFPICHPLDKKYLFETIKEFIKVCRYNNKENNRRIIDIKKINPIVGAELIPIKEFLNNMDEYYEGK